MLVYGRNVAFEYLKKVEKIRKIYLQDNFKDEKLISLIEKSKLPVVVKRKYELDELANGLHQGIILDVVDFSYANLDDIISGKDDCFLVILDHLEDPHNLGAIIRTSEAAAVDGIVIPKDRGVTVNATVIKTSVGAIENIPVSMVTNLSNTIQELKKNGFWIVGTDMVNSQDYREIDYSGKIALVIGNEGDGMSRLVRESCDFIARIPMYGKVNSLNASVAAGLMIYEVVRQKKG
ncbi:MAG: 23S rRNA (guanosine(2251)-2'-O)-methyltransferase RlmB [Firmicutes bacterium]|nr:23S rRNA (guanosine(2251)-2'-O)-methyltransferase RlmB [Bacillota bacterium]